MADLGRGGDSDERLEGDTDLGYSPALGKRRRHRQGIRFGGIRQGGFGESANRKN